MDKRFRSSTAQGAVVEFGLVRRALLRRIAEGTLRYEDICDAHPELLRAATNLGRMTGENCPVCHDQDLVEVTYVFGARLPAGGTCPTTRAELLKLERREEPVLCYAVEVCTACKFHHLARKWSAGGKRPRRSVQKKVGQ
jgi:RNA polymerase subunit RPABC4/transcription elongation factor Spt4